MISLYGTMNKVKWQFSQKKTPPFAGAKRRGRNREEARTLLTLTVAPDGVNHFLRFFVPRGEFRRSGRQPGFHK